MQSILLYAAIIIILLVVALRISVPFLSPQPENLGVTDGVLAPCPDSPNCVSSFAESDEHNIAPLPFTGTAEKTRANLLSILNAMPRLTIVTDTPNYIHATTRSRIMGYVDDNEFLFDDAAGVVHVRAAARMGYADMGANRARVETIRGMME